MRRNLFSKRILIFLKLPLLLYLTLFEINLFDREIKAEKKLLAATEKDLYLYRGMGASYLCIATKAGTRNF